MISLNLMYQVAVHDPLTHASTCFLSAAELPIRRIPHSGIHRGFGRFRGRIVGGQDATKGQFPYQVSLQWVVLGISSHTCGGSIISTKAVLTAGHCTQSGLLGYYVAVAGEHDLSADEGTEQTIEVADQILHPDYKPWGNVAINDVAVFTLQSELTLDTYVQKIALPVADSVPTAGSIAALSGWGSTKSGILPHDPDILQYVDVSVIGMTECYELLDNYSALNDNNVCTGPVTGGIAACTGDSGGPLAQDGTVIGIVSWGLMPCGSEGAPTVFTRVSAYEDFINQYL
ncbi:trypsin-1-like [Schistocerca serialis cubense]|uniref:trypsin-1-like n=1 Tax=Schistocerca serialis cubense TaxID=2023355 RepID=UPI00214E0F8A|nr:trypsin-1-like [Schistocerca serialis cubense]